MRWLVWTVLIYGVEWWILTKYDEKRIESAEVWSYRRMSRVTWTEHWTDQTILTELFTANQHQTSNWICCGRNISYFDGEKATGRNSCMTRLRKRLILTSHLLIFSDVCATSKYFTI